MTHIAMYTHVSFTLVITVLFELHVHVHVHVHVYSTHVCPFSTHACRMCVLLTIHLLLAIF